MVGSNSEAHKNKSARQVDPAGWPRSAVCNVHRDFKAKTHIAGSRFFPCHTVSPSCSFRKSRQKMSVGYPPTPDQCALCGRFAASGKHAKETHDFQRTPGFRGISPDGPRRWPNLGRDGASIVRMNETCLPNWLYPPLEPHQVGWLDVGDDHRIYFELCAQRGGLPLVFLHGSAAHYGIASCSILHVVG